MPTALSVTAPGPLTTTPGEAVGGLWVKLKLTGDAGTVSEPVVVTWMSPEAPVTCTPWTGAPL